MTSLPVRYVLISEERRNAYLDSGYNPPSGDYDMDAFGDEWASVFEKVEKAVLQRWKQGVSDGDFFMDPEFEPNRLFCIEVSNENMIGEPLLKAVHDAISTFEVGYAVDVCDSWVFLKTQDGQRYPHFNIFVEKNQILIYTESESLLHRLGIREECISRDSEP